MPQTTARKLAKTNQSVEKAFRLIEIMSENKEPMRLQDISARSSLPASTALRLVNTLLTYGYVNQDPLTLRYALSLKFAQIGSLVSSQISIRDIARPFIVEMSRKCKESACLAIEQDMEIVYIDVVDGPDGMLQITKHIGKRAPMHCTGIGKLFLAAYDNKQIGQYVGSKGLPVLTPNTIITREGLVSELDKIRKQGYAVDNEECELGARCIAAGIRDYTGEFVAGISVSGPVTRVTREHTETIIRIVKDTAAKVSAKLAYKGR